MKLGDAPGVSFISEGEWIELAEAEVDKDGTIPVKIVGTGWSKNGRYYSEPVLRAAIPVYSEGTQQFWNHPGPSKVKEQPSGDLNDLAGVLSEEAHYDPVGPIDKNGEPMGPGLYSRARPFSTHVDRIREMIGYIGISHRISGRQVAGEAEGRRGMIVEEILNPKLAPGLPAVTVDYVARPAAGGLPFSESEEGDSMTNTDGTPAQVATLEEAVRVKDVEIARLDKENKNLNQVLKSKDVELVDMKMGMARAKSREMMQGALEASSLKPASRKRVEESIGDLPMTDDTKLNEEAYAAIITEAIGKEEAYVEEITEDVGVYRGPGVPGGETTDYLATVGELHSATGHRR